MQRKSSKFVIDEPQKDNIANKIDSIKLKNNKKKVNSDTNIDIGTNSTDDDDANFNNNLNISDKQKHDNKAQKTINEKLFNIQKTKDQDQVNDLLVSLTNMGLNYKTNEQTPAIVQTLFVPPEQRVTKSVMTKFEFCSVLSTRAQQMENGSPIFVETGNLTNANAIAMKEIKERKCPLCIQRVICQYANGNSLAEIWEVDELALPDEYANMAF